MQPNSNFNIALTFSGGGYRAAGFSLGVLSFLDQVPLSSGSLLQAVSVLSTVSGGTITGSRYALGLKNGEDMKTIYHALYQFMIEEDLVKQSLNRLIKNEGWENGRTKNLINAIADVYDSQLFAGSLFGTLLQDQNPIHLKHIAFNATEFSNAVQFRFQASEKINNPGPNEPDRGIIGNKYYKLKKDIAAQMRMADILACSSCFPGGFEPVIFPDDFVLEKETKERISKEECYPVALMDGGIVDNQGITPVLLADARMKRNLVKSETDASPSNNHAIDLIIVSDVASPYIDAYKPFQPRRITWWQRLTPGFILGANTLLLLGALTGLAFSLYDTNTIMAAITSALATITLLVFLFGGMIKSLPSKFEVPEHFLEPLGKLLRLELHVYRNLILLRAKSILAMTGSVFLKHIRGLNYTTIFGDKRWTNRRIMNAIYELRPGEKRILDKVSSGVLPKYLVPYDAVQKVAAQASSMGTTLWFTKEELKPSQETGASVLDALIACGQFTICWNLLEYIEKIKRSNENTTENHKQLLALEPILVTHWKSFQEDPFWLTKKLKK